MPRNSFLAFSPYTGPFIGLNISGSGCLSSKRFNKDVNFRPLYFISTPGTQDSVFLTGSDTLFILQILVLFLEFSMTFGKCNICRYIFVDCKIHGKHLSLSPRAPAAFRLLNMYSL